MKTIAAVLAPLLAACGSKPPPPSDPHAMPVDPPIVERTSALSAAPDVAREKPTVVLYDEVPWVRGEGGTSLAVLSGDPNSGPASLLIKYPPQGAPLVTLASDVHVVVLSGVMVNAQDDSTKPTTLPASSYWYQPAHVAHAPTCISDAPCVVFVQTTGRLGMTPARPVTGAKRDPHYVEKRSSDLAWSPFEKTIPALGQSASLWGDASSQPSGMLVKLKPGEAPTWHIHKPDYQAVVLVGNVTHTQSGLEPVTLRPGAYVWQPGGYKHAETCIAGGADCVLYVSFADALMTKLAE
jgi:hypothetical protein